MIGISLSEAQLSVAVISEVFLYAENSVGIPGFIFTLQKIRSAPISLRDSCIMSFLPTDTPPVVMIISAAFAASFNFSDITVGSSLTASIWKDSIPSSRSLADIIVILLL